MADQLALIVSGVLLLLVGILFASIGTRSWPLLGLLLAGVLGGLLGGSAVAYYTSSFWVVAVAAILVGVGFAVAADHLAEAGMAMSLAVECFVIALASWDAWRGGSTLVYPLMILAIVVLAAGVAGAKFSPAMLFAAVSSMSSLLGLVLIGAYLNEDWSSLAMLAALLMFLGGLALQWFDLGRMRKLEKGLDSRRGTSIISAPPKM
ncbi:MAG TPA: hypothetical protein VI893_05425 [Thermoplasmata archaeon]|nr:hypothetical protein [Thermoplasmata archaeon]